MQNHERCCVLRTYLYKIRFHFYLFLGQKFLCCHFNFKKYSFSIFLGLRTILFQTTKTKLRFLVGPRTLSYLLRTFAHFSRPVYLALPFRIPPLPSPPFTSRPLHSLSLRSLSLGLKKLLFPETRQTLALPPRP